MKIGNVEIPNNVFLAPMAGVTDKPYRMICKEYGAGLTVSEMVSAKGMAHRNANTKALLDTDKAERPVAVQMFGSEPDIMAKMALELNSYEDIDIVDINMGCPVPKVVKNGEGSALMLRPELVADIVAAVSEASDKPVTVKIRKGFDDEHINAPEIAAIAEKNGAAAIAVHGRTREQYYSGKADWEIIKRVKQVVSIPVIGNGDVTDAVTAKQMLDTTGCDAVMIGRAAQGDPFIFKEVVHYLSTGEQLPPPTLGERISVMKKHIMLEAEIKGERVAVREMRKHIGWYTKGIRHGAKLRVQINQTESIREMLDLIESII